MDTATSTAPGAATPTSRPVDAGPLGVMDRCDRCGAQAYLRATMPSGAELLFCGHHGNEQRPALLIAGAAIHDETEKLTIPRESGFGG